MWITKDIPEGYKIVGMFLNTDYHYHPELFGLNLLPTDSQFPKNIANNDLEKYQDYLQIKKDATR